MFTPGRMIMVIGFLDAVENNVLVVTGKEFDIQGLSKEARDAMKNQRSGFKSGQQGNFQPQQPGFQQQQPQQHPVAQPQQTGTFTGGNVWGQG